MQRVWESHQFREIYDANTTPFETDSPVIRVQTFCHSTSYRNWKSRNDLPSPGIIAFLILSGRQKRVRRAGGREEIGPGFFAMFDLRTLDSDFIAASEKVERYFILLDPNPLLRGLLGQMFPDGLPAFQAGQPERIRHCFEKIRDEITRPDAEDARIGGAAYTLLHEAMTQRPAEPLPEALLLAKRCIDDRFHECRLARADVARAARVSVSTLAALFRRHLNTTIWGEIRDRRMAKARQLLTFSNKPVSEIASECGFSYAYYLTREFRASCGMTPLAYRRASRKM
ncbi:MAG: helix-turn-helix transcriptional regulator [Lentisphaeria bacterium]|nr:helix-turn-helix transcriptional regulator [Lentisphaeria bacterium]